MKIIDGATSKDILCGSIYNNGMCVSSLRWAGELRMRFWQAKYRNQKLFAERVWKPNQRFPNRSFCEAFGNLCIARQ